MDATQVPRPLHFVAPLASPAHADPAAFAVPAVQQAVVSTAPAEQQADVMGACWTPAIGSHQSVVHGLPSFTTGGTPDRQTPVASQVSAPLQALPSLHEAPGLGVTAQAEVPLQVRVLQASDVQLIGVPVQVDPPWQVSLNVQAFPSSHADPAGK